MICDAPLNTAVSGLNVPVSETTPAIWKLLAVIDDPNPANNEPPTIRRPVPPLMSVLGLRIRLLATRATTPAGTCTPLDVTVRFENPDAVESAKLMKCGAAA